MAIMNRETVQITLETEIPEIRQGDAIGVLCGLIIAIVFLMLGSLGLYCYVVRDPHPAGMIIVPILAVIASYFIGAQLDPDSSTMVGADIAQDGAERYNRGMPGGFNQELGMDQMQLGMGLMAGQFLFGAVYTAVKYLRDRGTMKDNNQADIAATIIHHVLTTGAATQDALFALPDLARHEVQELRTTLSILTQKGFLESRHNGFGIAPPKKYLFD